MLDNKSLLSIDYDDDDDNYDVFKEFVENNTYQQKKKFLSEIEENGDNYQKIIDKNKVLRKENIIKEIDYILSKSKEFTKEELYSFDEKDVLDIYNIIKEKNKPIIFKMFRFLINGK